MKTVESDSTVGAEMPRSDHFSGAEDAAVLLLEYGDYECHFCSEAEPVTAHVMGVFGDRMKFVFRHFPLYAIHSHAELAAEAAEAAGAQGKFWQMHHLLMSKHQHLQPSALNRYAESIDLDMPRFKQEMADRIYRCVVTEQHRCGVEAGVRSTPTFFLNGKLEDTTFGIENLEIAIRAALGEH